MAQSEFALARRRECARGSAAVQPNRGGTFDLAGPGQTATYPCISRCDKSRRSAGGRRTDGRVCAYGDAQRRAGAYRRLIHWSRPTLRWFRRAFGTGIGGSAAGSTISRSRGTNVCLHPATSPPAHGRRARRAGLLLIRQDQNYPQNQAASTRPMSQDTPPPRVRRDLSSWNRGTRSSHTGTRFCRPRSGTCSRRSLPRPRACRAARR